MQRNVRIFKKKRKFYNHPCASLQKSMISPWTNYFKVAPAKSDRNDFQIARRRQNTLSTCFTPEYFNFFYLRFTIWICFQSVFKWEETFAGELVSLITIEEPTVIYHNLALKTRETYARCVNNYINMLMPLRSTKRMSQPA